MILKSPKVTHKLFIFFCKQNLAKLKQWEQNLFSKNRKLKSC